MPSFEVATPGKRYFAKVERGILEKVSYYLPETPGKLFIVTTEDVWRLHGARLARTLARPHSIIFFRGGELNKRLFAVEEMAEQMVACGADRRSLVLAFGGGIVGDMAGFLAASFMRGIPVVQVPTTLLAQVDASIGGKTGVNLVSGKNLFGAFHQPEAVLIDPEVLTTLQDREYRAGLYEVIKCGVIASPRLFEIMFRHSEDVLAKTPAVVDEMISECVRIKAEVVTADEREGGLRRILNFGHTIGHALEAETNYTRFLHGEAVAFGMAAIVQLALLTGDLSASSASDVLKTILQYGPIPSLEDISSERLAMRLAQDKKTVLGQVHFVMPQRIGSVKVVSGVDEQLVLSAIRAALG
ncbi:MAG: 3-dehydroquinate synthase [Bryobacterales bacterium]|nr:3-dehydroquinate synthase [Bryobacterales bacterium]